MNLLFNRDQKSASLFTLVPLKIGSSVGFTLHAELELDTDEAALVKQYKFAKTALVISDPIDDVKQAIRPALLLGIITYIVTFSFVSLSASWMLALLVTAGMTVVYFKTLREQILVSDLMNGGRTFRCDSIVELIRKEAYLEGIAGYLRQVLESAKNWTDRETIEIQPLDRDEAKRAVARGLMEVL